MLHEKKRLEHNKEIVDEFMRQKMVTYAEMIAADDGLEFFEYFNNEGITNDFAGVKYNRKRKPIANNEVFPLIYMVHILSGEWSVRRTQKILKNEAVARILGFTDEQINGGLTRRGVKNQYGGGFERKSGLMAPTTVIDNLACFDYEGCEKCLGAYIGRVSASGEVDLGDIYILDSTIVETGEGYPGAKPTRRRDEEGEEAGDLIWGFKVFILSSAKTMTPVAIHITTANDADSPMLLEMVKRGVANLGEGKIKTVVADRGFIDGAQMYQLKYKIGIDFVIPARKNMDIWKCVTGLRDGSNIEKWEYGKKGMSGGYLSKGSVSYAQYAEEPAGTKKGRSGAPINAVVVTHWAGNEIKRGNEKVILSSLNTNSAIKVMQVYGQRPLIENRNFRELKQAAALCSLPQYLNKDAEATAKLHMLLCVFSLAVFTVMVAKAYSGSAAVAEKIPKNLREFRFVNECSKSRVFILVKNYYHIYPMKEFMEFAGFAMVPAE